MLINVILNKPNFISNIWSFVSIHRAIFASHASYAVLSNPGRSGILNRTPDRSRYHPTPQGRPPPVARTLRALRDRTQHYGHLPVDPQITIYTLSVKCLICSDYLLMFGIYGMGPTPLCTAQPIQRANKSAARIISQSKNV